MFDQYFTEEERKGFLRDDYDCSLTNTIYAIPMPGYTFALGRGDGTMLTHEQVEDFIESVMMFYERVDPRAIRARNKQAEARRSLTSPPPAVQKKPGYVYVLRTDNGYYKIGRSVNPANRFLTFKLTLPFTINYEIVIYDSDHIALEAALHERYDYCREAGEWFALTDDDIAALKAEFENIAERFNE